MKKIFLVILVVIIGVGIYYSLPMLSKQESEPESATTSTSSTTKNTPAGKPEVKAFTKLLIDKVLRADKAVSLEDREKLESSLAALNDPKLTNLWQKFVTSDTQVQAEENLWKLIEGLVDKM